MIGKIVLSVGLILDFIGAFLLALSEYKTKTEIATISGTYVGKNPHLEKSLKLKSQVVKLASPLLAVGFVLQLVGINIPN